jgi:branched-chain amino acid transport system permease protein
MQKTSFIDDLKQSLLISVWFMLLTFPIMVIRVNTIQKVIQWRWMNLVMIGVGAFVLSYVWRFFMARKEAGAGEGSGEPWHQRLMENEKIPIGLIAMLMLWTAAALPLFASEYRVNVMINAMIYILLGLGLNIVVGLAGLLDLGYVAFYLVGAYAYALLNMHFGLGFWLALPLGGLLAGVFGILLGIPVLRLRGDYLAIVTLGFGEILRLVMENWSAFSEGPSGIANIDMPTVFGHAMTRSEGLVFIYYLMIALAVFTIFVVNRLQNSRLGRSWVALREDEIACQAMGIDKMKTKLAAFALGATWAGFAGVIFAAKTRFINPASFTFLESAIILSIVVLGGMGSILGVILASFVLILLPEELRAFSEYRMLIFGASMVLMMVFRPQGLIANVRTTYEYQDPGHEVKEVLHNE